VWVCVGVSLCYYDEMEEMKDALYLAEELFVCVCVCVCMCECVCVSVTMMKCKR